ncbi:Flagellar assembly factor FliW [Bienertia sinuspersici]
MARKKGQKKGQGSQGTEQSNEKNPRAQNMNPNTESSSNKVENELEVSDDEVLTPKSALISLQQQSKMKEQASKWMTMMKGEKHEGVSYRLTWSEGIEATIGLEDMQPKLKYWTNSVVAYVLGSNPPLNVMDGFLRRVCKSHGVDKVNLLNKGIYLVRMNSEEGKLKAMAAGVQFFDKKPVIVHQWDPEEDYSHKDSDNVLEKLLQTIGNFRKVDQSTKDRNKLLYARVLG